MRPALVAPLLAVIAYTASIAQSPQISAGIENGRIGERYDGYLGFAGSVPDELRRQVSAINIRRRSLYTQVATQRGVTVELVGMTTACALFRDLPVGEAYLLNDNIWRRRSAGDSPPVPSYCRSNSDALRR